MLSLSDFCSSLFWYGEVFRYGPAGAVINWTLEILVVQAMTFCHEALTQSYRLGLLGDKLLQGDGDQAEEVLLLSLEKVYRCFLEELATGHPRMRFRNTMIRKKS